MYILLPLLLLAIVPVYSAGTGDLLPVAESAEEALEDLLDDLNTLEQEEKLEREEELFPLLTDEESDAALSADDAVVTVRIGSSVLTLTDVPSTAWFAPYVRDAAEKGIVSGYRDASGNPTGLYGPADHVTIEQLAKIVIESARIDETSCGSLPPKNPSARGGWSAQYIACAESLKFAVFSDASVFVPRKASRAEVVVTLLQAFGVPSGGIPEEQTFEDVSSSTEFRGAIEQAYRDGIISGYADEVRNSTGQFGPFDPVNRAEIAKMISRAIHAYGER